MINIPTNLVFTTDIEQAYTVPNDTGSIAFHAVGGDVAMMSEAGGAEWTIMEGEKESINTRDLANEVMYFTGNTGTTLEIRILEGLLS